MTKQIEKTPFFDTVTLEILKGEQYSIDEFASTALANIIRGDVRSTEVNQLAVANEKAQETTEAFTDGQLRTFSADRLYEHADIEGTKPLKYVNPEHFMHTEVQVCGIFQGVHAVVVETPDKGNKFILAAEIKAYIAAGSHVFPERPMSLYLPYESLKIMDSEPEEHFPEWIVKEMREALASAGK